MHRPILPTAASLFLLLSAAACAQAPTPAAITKDICGELSFPADPTAGPPVLKPANEKVRVLAFGDYGDGGANQKTVAKAMLEYHQKPGQPFDFGITLGDNFYGTGLNSPADPRWKTNWEDLYGPLGIRLYASLGNHDYYDSASPIAETLYSQKSASWCLPGSYVVSGAGGHDKRPLGADPQNRRLWGVGETLGFSVLEADGTSLTMSFFNETNARLCQVKLSKSQPAVVSCP